MDAPPIDPKALAFVALVLTIIAVLWRRRRSASDHDVSDPGITL